MRSQTILTLLCVVCFVPLSVSAQEAGASGFGERHEPQQLRLVSVEITVPEVGDVPIRFRQYAGPDTPRHEPFYVAGWQELPAGEHAVTLPVGLYIFGARTRPERRRLRHQWEYAPEPATIEHSARYELRHVSRAEVRTALVAGGSVIAVIGASLLAHSLVQLSKDGSSSPILGVIAAGTLTPGGTAIALRGAFMPKERMVLVGCDS